MLELAAVWGGVGAIGGAMVGLYRCGDQKRYARHADKLVQVLFCGGVGSLIGMLVFTILAAFFYELGTITGLGTPPGNW